jgi:hypothetical protein
VVTDSVLMIRRHIWWALVRQLKLRGRGERESGAFLLGRRTPSGNVVQSFVCYDDVDPTALETGIVVIRSLGFKRLWAICRARGFEVLADAHTHGNDAPRQSSTDKRNPVISEPGHLALIVPSFAHISPFGFGRTAVYEYLGDYEWRDWTTRREDRVRLALW